MPNPLKCYLLKEILRKNAPFVMVEKTSDNPLNKFMITIWPVMRYLFSYDSMKTEHIENDLSTPSIKYYSINRITEILRNCDYQVRRTLYHKCTILSYTLYLTRQMPHLNVNSYNLLEKSIVSIDEKMANFFGYKFLTMMAAWVCLS